MLLKGRSSLSLKASVGRCHFCHICVPRKPTRADASVRRSTSRSRFDVLQSPGTLSFPVRLNCHRNLIRPPIEPVLIRKENPIVPEFADQLFCSIASF